MNLLKTEDVKKINSELSLLNAKYCDLISNIHNVRNNLKTDEAQEYICHGVSRRLDTLTQCIVNIFQIFPLERVDLLRNDELKNLAINLHAFFVNIFGLLDNLAWVVIHERKLVGKISRNAVGLYSKKTQEHLNNEFCAYLNSDHMKKWHNKYLKNYRDALAHRIPIYVPPKILNSEQKDRADSIDEEIMRNVALRNFNKINKLHKEDDEMGEVCPYFTHSLSENEYVFLHAQVIADFNTVEEIVRRFCQMFNRNI